MLRLDQEIRRLRQEYETCQLKVDLKSTFADLPLSQKTLKGLSEANFLIPTDIQRESILPAILGRDVVCVAETGSGKTLAFLIPILEHLFVNKWSRAVGGLAALIIAPTRELAYQLFETLRKIGKYHDFSAGLIIGGKNLRFERKRMDQCNILICTPGRLLQNMDENPYFHVQSMEILVLDEVDRCLDNGFEPCLNSILNNLPSGRQNLLFSATQTNNAYLSRLNLQNPIYVGKYCQTNNITAVPDLLKQNYVVVKLENKLAMLWSFIKNHLKQKILVFMSSCKQVKYVYEIFCKLRPAIGLLALFGTLNQDRRISIYNEFFRRNHVVLFATDIASRGLDFPNVNWIVQLDCPEDVTQYIHRAGRCARNKAHGENLLVLMPSEEVPMITELKEQNINLRKIEIDPKKLFSPEGKLKELCARSPELKVLAKRAFIAYIKSIYLMKNRTVFDVSCLDLEKFAESLGLVAAPRIRFLERHIPKDSHNYIENESDILHEQFLSIKQEDHNISHYNTVHQEENPKRTQKRKTKAALAKKSVSKYIKLNKRFCYGEDGNEISIAREFKQNGLDIVNAKNLLCEEDKNDKLRFKEIIQTRRRKLKKKKQSKCPNVGFEDSCKKDVDTYWTPNPDDMPKSRTAKEENIRQLNAFENCSLQDTENIASLLLSYT